MLKFHGTPIGGTSRDAILFLSGRNALFSFFTKGHIKEVVECCDLFIVDNGAFSHWKTTGGKINVKEYADFVDQYQYYSNHHFHIIPDVIGGTEDENDALLQEWECLGVSKDISSCSPVFHLGESVERFKRLRSKYPIVSLGSTDKWPKNGSNQWWNNMADFMDEITDSKGNAGCKLHGLRMLDPKIFTKLPLHSADSTNASVNGHRCMKEGILKDLERWQGNIRIAQRIEHYQSAPYWNRDNLKMDLHGFLEDCDE